MAGRVLTLRELNRATLARQLLLERAALPVPAAIERLAGLQAQLPSAPFAGLWTRLQDFRREDLAQALTRRDVVKATLMRATLHLVTAEDYLLLRATLRPVLEGAFASVPKGRAQGLDFEQVVTAALPYIAAQPRTFAEIGAMLSQLMPGVDVGVMRYAVRMHLPLVQVPVEGGWSYPGNPQFTLAETWLGRPVRAQGDLRALVYRYLAAFGPASVRDLQAWSGLAHLQAAIEELKPDLRVYRDIKGRELFDLADQPLPPADMPVPARFLPEYDNLLRAHELRTRVIADEHRARVYLSALRVAPTFLVDGFVAGTWQIVKTKGVAGLLIEPFAALAASERAALIDEAEHLVRFVVPDAKRFEVRVAD